MKPSALFGKIQTPFTLQGKQHPMQRVTRHNKWSQVQFRCGALFVACSVDIPVHTQWVIHILACFASRVASSVNNMCTVAWNVADSKKGRYESTSNVQSHTCRPPVQTFHWTHIWCRPRALRTSLPDLLLLLQGPLQACSDGPAGKSSLHPDSPAEYNTLIRTKYTSKHQGKRGETRARISVEATRPSMH